MSGSVDGWVGEVLGWVGVWGCIYIYTYMYMYTCIYIYIYRLGGSEAVSGWRELCAYVLVRRE